MAAQDPAQAGKVKFGTLMAFAMAGLPVGALATPLTVYLPNFFAGYVGVPLATVGFIFLCVKVLDLIFDPIAGMVMDGTRTRFGRYRFWMLVSVPILLLGVYMLFMAKPGAGAGYLLLWLIIFYVGLSLLVLSQSAWGAVLAKSYTERSRTFAALAFTGVAGAATVLLTPTLLKVAKTDVVPTMGWVILISIPVCVAICAFVREPVTPRREGSDKITLAEVPRLIGQRSMIRLLATDLLLTLGPGFTAPLYLYFFQGARGYTPAESAFLLLIYIVAGLFFAPMWAAVAAKLEKHRTLLVSALLYSVAQAGIFLIPHHNVPIMMGGMFLAGGIAAAFGFLIRAMVADVADEVRLETGKERAGLLYAFVTSTVKIGTASAVITLPLLQVFGFDPRPGAVNTPEAMNALVMTYAFLPIVAVALGGLVMLTYKLDAKRHAEIRAELDKRDAAAGTHVEREPPGLEAVEVA